MLKKITLTICLLFVLMFSANAVTVLNSCGKSSGWTQGETYILDFTEIPIGYANDYCFQFPGGTSQDFIIEGNGSTINIEKTGLQFFQHTGSATVDNVSIQNFKVNYLTSSNSNIFYYLYGGSEETNRFRYSDMTNLEVTGAYNFVYTRARSLNNREGRFGENNLENLKIFTEGTVFAIERSSGSFDNVARFINNNISNSLFVSEEVTTGKFFEHKSSASNTVNNIFTNVVIKVDDSTSYQSPNGDSTNYSNSILSGKNYSDANDNNIGDTVVETYIIDPVMYLDILGYRFIQDSKEGRDFNNWQNQTIIPVNDETISVANLLALLTGDGTILDSSLVDFTLTSNYLLQVQQDNTLDCSIINSDQCYINESFGTTSVNDYRGLILINTNTKINNLEFHKQDSNNAHIISNDYISPVTESNIEISNNDFYKQDDLHTDGDSHFIKLKAIELNMHDNIFYMLSSSNGVYEVLDIESSNAVSNIITENQFVNLAVPSSGNSEVFTNNCDAIFFNNKLLSDINISDSCSSGLTPTYILNYKHTDDKIYQFEIGNYYSDNIGCVDADVNGICDSSFTSGVITDTKPLSSYPFDPSIHILTADSIVDNSTYNINLINITDNENITIDDGSIPLIFTFQHDSDFTDLTCDFIIDAVSVNQTSSPAKLTNINSPSLTSWTEKTYSHRVECFNQILINGSLTDNYISSTEIDFNIIFGTSENGGSETNTSTEGMATSDEPFVDLTDFSFDGFLTGDVTETGDNVVALFGVFEQPIGYMYIFGVILFFLVMLATLFVFVRLVVTGGFK